MKKSTKLITAIFWSIFLLVGLNSCSKDDENLEPNTTQGSGTKANWQSTCDCLNMLYPIESLSKEEKEALIFMREEEKLARDVYEHLYATWNHHVFDNITTSENQHISIVLCLMEKYKLEDPAANLDRGIFKNKTLQDLYNVLVEEGDKSLVDAFQVGATIEDVDIFDLGNYGPDIIDNEDIQIAFQELTKGSRNHLRAFVKNLENLGATYTAQYISAENLEAITSSNKETNEIICSGS